MGSDVRRGIQSADLSVQIGPLARTDQARGPLEEFVTIDDLQNAASARSITEVHPIPEPDRSVQWRRHWLLTRLLPDYTIIADVTGMGGIRSKIFTPRLRQPSAFLCATI